MKEVFGSMGPHDTGGHAGEKINPIDEGMKYWEKIANALLMVVARKGISSIDEMRRGREDIERSHDELGYFERQTEALATNLVERQVVTWEILNFRMKDVEARFNVPNSSLADHHEHSHRERDHPLSSDEEACGEASKHHLMTLAMQDILEEQGLLAAGEIRQMIENFDHVYPYRGATVVARAWVDAGFKKRLMKDARQVIEGEMDLDLEVQPNIIALENTEMVHNVVVCTLCSCYPRFLLGHPPSWYKSRSYRSRMVYEPRAVLREFGTVLPEGVAIRVHDSTADMRYIVVPMRPEGTEDWSESELERIVSRDCLVGTTVPKP